MIWAAEPTGVREVLVYNLFKRRDQILFVVHSSFVISALSRIPRSPISVDRNLSSIVIVRNGDAAF